MMTELNPAQKAIVDLIRRFVDRQKLVLEAMSDLYPDPAMWFKGSPRAWSVLSRRYAMKPPKGYWGEKNEWEYFLHGPGCRLTNLDTGEPVQWDAPDLHRFDRSWFVHWVNWLMKQTHDETVSTLKTAVEASNKILQTFIYELLEQLEEAGLITRADPYPVGYTLNF